MTTVYCLSTLERPFYLFPLGKQARIIASAMNQIDIDAELSEAKRAGLGLLVKTYRRTDNGWIVTTSIGKATP